MMTAAMVTIITLMMFVMMNTRKTVTMVLPTNYVVDD